ncbi:MAG TPA: hypothetical protein VG754_02710 [Verrucomicrobiae bacterium]|jgi:hypothetical protein|nr:hypothetical protein [Verrucomicrobiae bacterium]
MKKYSKWPDFLFTLTVRFICGFILGGAACILVTFKGIMRAFANNHLLTPVIWVCVFGIAGGLVAVFTIPAWQRPWYKGIREQRRDELLNRRR